MTALSIESVGLTKRFGSVTAVDHLTFKVAEGEILGLLGPNGAGKTTTVRILACLISASEGSATVTVSPLWGHLPIESARMTNPILKVVGFIVQVQ